MADGLLDLVAHLGHGDVARVRKTVCAGNRVACEEDHGETGFLDEAGREAIVGAAMGENLGRIRVRLEHHCAKAAGLHGGDLAPDVLEGGGDIFGHTGLSGLLDFRRAELERVRSGVDN